MSNYRKFDKKIQALSGLQEFFFYSTVKLPRKTLIQSEIGKENPRKALTNANSLGIITLAL